MFLTITEPNTQLVALIGSLSPACFAVRSVIDRKITVKELAQENHPLRIRYEIPLGKLVTLNPIIIR